MIELNIADKQYYLPENWDEVFTSGKYLRLMDALNQPATPEAARLNALRAITGMDIGEALNSIALEKTDITELIISAQLQDEVFPALDFIFDRTAFYKNPLPKFEHQNRWFVAPGDNLHGQTGEEWSISHHAQYLYNKTGEKKHLIALIAANYHYCPPLDGVADRPGEDGRLPFTEQQFEKDLAVMGDLPDNIINGIYLWYQHADEWWMKHCPWLYTREDASNPAPGGGQGGAGMEIRDILFELAGNKLDDAWDKVRYRSRQDLVYALNRMETKRQELEAARS